MIFEFPKNIRDILAQKVGGYPVIPIDDKLPRNLIVYGAPGTGKSYFLDEKINDYFSDDRLFTRVTFHPNYSYSQFVGSYKPVPLYKKSSDVILRTNMSERFDYEPLINYEFVPGPFIEMLSKAYKNKKSNFLILVEEINRANVASVFGDVFQLLDRDDNGYSQYPVAFNPDVMEYLRSKGITDDKIKIPSNLYIWSTMNSSDQGVNPMDTAFKRRWSFKYLPLNEKENVTANWELNLRFLSKPVKWNKFREVINNKIKGKVPEDKLIGPFFLKKTELPSKVDDEDEQDIFINKLLLYLREDVLRHNPGELFASSTFSDIVTKYKDKKNIFNFPIEELEGNE
jgi:MoxR-like ATPase